MHPPQHHIKNLATPTAATEGANKGYVDGLTGNLGDLQTSATGDLVLAINELAGLVATLQGQVSALEAKTVSMEVVGSHSMRKPNL